MLKTFLNLKFIINLSDIFFFKFVNLSKIKDLKLINFFFNDKTLNLEKKLIINLFFSFSKVLSLVFKLSIKKLFKKYL